MGNAGVNEVGWRGYNLGEGVDMCECVGVHEGITAGVAVVLPVKDVVASVVSSPIGFAAANETNKECWWMSAQVWCERFGLYSDG